MTAASNKTRKIILIALAALLLTALTAVCGSYAIHTVTYDIAMDRYLSSYAEAAEAYLTENQAFAEEYGEVSLDVSSYSYGYLEPKKYSRLSLCPKAPATAEDFEAELAYLTVSVRISDVNAVNVLFEKTPDGHLEITGWENADE